MYRNHGTGKRRAALIICAVYSIKQAVAYLPPIRTEAPQEPLIMASAGLPALFTLYVFLWALSGLYCLYHLHDGHILRPMGFVAGMSGLWGGAWLTGWIARPETMWWQTALTYLCIAGLITVLTSLTPRWPALDESGGDD